MITAESLGFRFACDSPGCHSSLFLTGNKTRDRAIADAQRDGFSITGPERLEKVLCPECARNAES